MPKKLMLVGLIALFMLALTACGGGKQNAADPTASSNNETAQSTADNTGTSKTRTIEYLGESYTAPQKVEKIVITGVIEVKEKLEKIAPTILVSHIATDWEANLKLMAELAGKQAEAKKVLSQYKTDTQAVKSALKEKHLNQ